MKIGNCTFSTKSDNVFVIAEIGNNHNGDFDRAIELINLAKNAGADCAKFQMRSMNQLYRKNTLARSGDDLSTEYTLDLLERFELSLTQQQKLADYCREIGITYMCTPWDSDSISNLEKLEVEAYKVASADLTNLPLIEELIQTKKPLILSTGMSSEKEIEKTVTFLNEKKTQFALLHCNSTYPAPIRSINLRYLENLAKIHPLIGYSGHERGTAVTIGAVALGAKIVERHFTLDRTMEGPDHAASLEPAEFKGMIDGIREIELALGQSKKSVSQGELINRENLGKSLVAATPLKKGHKVEKADIIVRSPGQGLSPQYFNELIGIELKRDMEEEDYFFHSDLSEKKLSSKSYHFERPWGVPVRYHDFDKFHSMTKMDLVEFHLSYSDMNLSLSDFFTGTYDLDFVVHAPELFEGSRLMDLATPDKDYCQYSIEQTQRVIDITRDLKKYFPKTTRPMIVANIGGFSMDGNVTEEEKTLFYSIFADSLKKLDIEGVELIPQTMAPFPWHFGGQRYQNLFVHPKEIVEKCLELELRICLDVSHSKLTSNHFGYDFYQFVNDVGPYVGHLHLGDAVGLDGEGLQVGEGEIDFNKLGTTLDKVAPKAPFIPEIWQGHKNDGEGFWLALERLEEVFQ